MTDQEIIIEVAKLDGWTRYSPGDFNPTERYTKNNRIVEPDDFAYLTSRDAIVPVIEKLPEHIKLEIVNRLAEMTHGRDAFKAHYWPEIVFSTPRQLCIALLKATGKL